MISFPSWQIQSNQFMEFFTWFCSYCICTYSTWQLVNRGKMVIGKSYDIAMGVIKVQLLLVGHVASPLFECVSVCVVGVHICTNCILFYIAIYNDP